MPKQQIHVLSGAGQAHFEKFSIFSLPYFEGKA
jgi:hypothetical protein